MSGESPFSASDDLNTGHRRAVPAWRAVLCHWLFVTRCFVSLPAPQDPLAVNGKLNLLSSLILVDLSLTEREGKRQELVMGQSVLLVQWAPSFQEGGF